MKNWVEWSSSFDYILGHPRFLSYCNNEASATIIYYMVDMLYKIEVEMSKVIAEVKAITYVKQTKCLDELEAVRNATWLDVDTYITV